jgi:DNA-binding transcriptional ArsR family regulator/tetrahydromethanopterin S-methyltransferase subunit G
LKPITDINDPRLVKAMAHPLRVQILGILEQRVASPRELADELEAPLGNVSYHVRTLSSLGLIKLVKKTPRRGAIEHYYEARGRAVVTDRAWAEVPEIVKRALVGATLGEVSERVNEAAAKGGFDRADAHLTSPRVIVDEQGFRELSTALNDLFDRVDKIQRESTKRLKGGDGAIEAGVVAMLFERSNGGGAGANSNTNADGAANQTRAKAGARG